MNRIIRLALSFSFAMLLGVASSHAQSTRTWVSGVGDDANPCSRTAPCKTFAGAISKTAAGGEINAIDPGGFGAVTITKSVSIIAEGVTAGVLASSTNGITVNLPSATDNVVLQGLDIEGAGTGLKGINMIGNGDLIVKNCDIRGFTGAASGFGIFIESTLGPRVLIQDSTINGNNGGVVAHNTVVIGSTIITNSVIDKNANFAVRAVGANTTVFLSGNVISGNPAVLSTSSGGTITSYGNNVLLTGAPTNTLTLQ